MALQKPSRIATIKQQGRLTAAVQDDFPPFSFLDTHQQRVGFAVDLMREFARRWLEDAAAVTLVPVTTDQRMPTLLEGRVDLIAAAVTHTPTRQQQIAFSHPYVQDGQRLLVPEHAEVNDMCDLHGKNIVVTRGATAMDHVQAQARACGFTAQLRSVASDAEAVLAVLKGEADAFSTNGLALERLATGRPLKAVGRRTGWQSGGMHLDRWRGAPRARPGGVLARVGGRGRWKRPFDFPILGLAQDQPDMETLVKKPVLREKREAPVNKSLGVTAQAK